MGVRHEVLIHPEGIALRRTHGDGCYPAHSYWYGREIGWAPIALDRALKRYKTRSQARAALGRILRHETELGIHRRIGRRY